MFGQYQEDPIANRAFRLLQAATLGTAVQPVSPHQMAVMDRIAELGGGSLQDHFAKLVELEPRLARLADQARSGRFGRFPAMPETGVASPEPLLAAAAAANEVRQRIKIVLVPLVGPDRSPVVEPLRAVDLRPPTVVEARTLQTQCGDLSRPQGRAALPVVIRSLWVLLTVPGRQGRFGLQSRHRSPRRSAFAAFAEVP